MAEKRLPDPTLIARLQLSVKGVDWATSLVRGQQHVQLEGEWSAHQNLYHLLAVERELYQPRIEAAVRDHAPVFESWDSNGIMANRYEKGTDLVELAEQFMVERERTVEVLKGLSPEQWLRTATWPSDGEVDLGWVAELVLSHGLQHFVALLLIHQKLDHYHARSWVNAAHS